MSEVFSYSRIGTYLTCPYSYYLTYVDRHDRENGVYGVLGGKLHEIMEELEHGKITNEQALEKWKSEVDYMELMEELNFPTEKSKLAYLEDIELYLEYFTPIQFGNRKAFVEEHFEIELLDKYKLQGYIDLYIVDEEKKEIEIVDYKTSSKSSFSKSCMVEKCRQLVLYGMALEEKYPDYKIVSTNFDMVKYAVVGKKVKERKDLSLDELFESERYFISAEYNDETKKELLDYVRENIDQITDMKTKSKSAWRPIKNKFYCVNLCSVSGHCKYCKK